MRAFAALVCVSLVLPPQFWVARGDHHEPNSSVAQLEDLQPPVITIDIPDDSLWIKQVTPYITVSDDTDPDPFVEVKLNDKPYQSGTLITQPGIYELQVVARDAAGNSAEKFVLFQVLENPHYKGALSLVEWRWRASGEYAGLDAWIILKGPFHPDARLKSLNGYPEKVQACSVLPIHLSLKVIDVTGRPLTVGQVLPLNYSKCELHEPRQRPSVYYDYENDFVAIHYRVDPKEHRLRNGIPARVKVVGFARVPTGEFTFEASATTNPDPSMDPLLQDIINKGVNIPIRGDSVSRSLSQCQCTWKRFPASPSNPDVDGDHRSRRCAVSPAWTEEKYKINARPSRIDGWGYAFDMCEAQNAMIPTPGHRGVVQSGFSAIPALEHFGPCCCEKGSVITVAGNVAFSVTVRTRGDSNAAIAGVISIANDIEDLRAAGGLTLGSGARGGTVSIGPVTVPILVPVSNPGTQLFF